MNTKKDIILLTVSRVTQIIYLFLSYKLLSYYLPKQELGLYFLLLSMTTYFSLVIVNPIGVYINRFVHQWKTNHQINEMFFIFVLFLCGICLLSLPILYMISSFFESTKNIPLLFSISIALYFFSASLNNTIIPNLNILNYRTSFVIFTFLTQFTALFLSVALVLNTNPSGAYWMAGHSFSFLIFGFISLFYLFRKFSFNFSQLNIFKHYKKIDSSLLIKFCYPIIIINICLWILTQYYRPFAEKNFGLEYLSFIGLGFGVAASISVSGEYLLQQILLPKFYSDINEASKESRTTAWNTYANTTIPQYLALSIFVSLLAPFIIRIISSEQYLPAVPFLIIGIWIDFFRVNSNIFNLISHSEIKTEKSIKPYLLAATITLLLSFLSALFPQVHLATPLSFLIGNSVAFLSLFLLFKAMITYKLEFRLFLIKNKYSLIYLTAPLFYSQNSSFFSSVGVMTVYGAFFIFIQYKVFTTSLQETT